MWPFVEGSVEREAFDAIVSDAYATFDHPDVVPVSTLADGIGLVELFHGPTLAFKDVAMQLLGRLFDHELDKRDSSVTIVGATSGDTGSAAIEAFRDRENVRIIILHPHGRTSEVQRRQMTTVHAPNVRNVAVEGTFDDCQDMVKAMFADEQFRQRVNLGAVNSINWARVMAQVVYYHWAVQTFADADETVDVVVPTGNFGNVFAGRVAKRMGAAIDRFVVASNRNDILTQFFVDGSMTISDVQPSLSPSMDIQVSSNLERLMHELLGGDGAAVESLLRRFRADGHVAMDAPIRSRMGELWSGESLTDAQTLKVIAQVHDESGVLLDPHSAVGVGAARRRAGANRQVVMATAHPAKFPDAVETATGIRPPLPDALADLYEREERYDVASNDLEAVKALVESA
jgi:threonine synthase